MSSKSSTVRDTFYENGSNITIVFYAKNTQRDTIRISLKNQQMLSVHIPFDDGSVYNRDIQLYGDVRVPVAQPDDAVAVPFSHNPFKVEVKLTKVTSQGGDDAAPWGRLERGEEQVAPRPNAYSSAAAGDTTRWDSLEDEPAGDINSVLQSIFSQGDESVRRAMLKSYQTSGGTVLSTNWNEVKDADYSNKPDTN